MIRRLLWIVGAGVLLIGAAVAAYPSLRVRQLAGQLRGDEHDAGVPRQALVTMLGRRAVPFFTARLEDPESNVRLQSAEALFDLLDERSLPLVAPLMSDYNERLRQRIVEEAGCYQGPESDALLLPATADSDPWVRYAAVSPLAERARHGRDRRPAILAALARAVNDTEPEIVSSAMSAMRGVAGIDFRYRSNLPLADRQAAVARWRTWWQRHRPDPLPALPPPVPITASTPAPPLAVTDVSGKRWSLERLRGHASLIHFFGSWCANCHFEMQDLERLHQQRPELVILGLGLAEKGPEALRDYASRCRLTFPLALAPETVREAYGDVEQVPVTFVVDGHGRIRRRFDGFRDLNTFQAALREIRAADRD
jgi:peroxiredoxin